MNIVEAMRTFVRVVDSGGFSAAARQLALAVSSVARQIDALEAELGCSSSAARRGP